MTETQGGLSRFFSSLKRFFSFQFLFKSKRIDERADAIFTKSSDGIKAGYDLTKEQWVKQYRELRDAIANLLELQEQRQVRYDNLAKEEKELLAKREGALAMYEKAQESGNAEEIKKHEAAFNRFHTRIQEIDQQQEELLAELEAKGKELGNYKLRLTDFQERIQRLDEEKQEAIADFVTSKKTVELNERLAGIATALESGPLEAIRNKRLELKARAKLSSELAGTDVVGQDLEYQRAGQTSTSDSALSQMLAERKAKQQETGVQEKKTREEDRADI